MFHEMILQIKKWSLHFQTNLVINGCLRKKASQKLYRRHSGRPGGMKIEKFETLRDRIPERIIEQAVKGMLPHNSLGRQQFKKLKVYKGSEHPHDAQNPVFYFLIKNFFCT